MEGLSYVDIGIFVLLILLSIKGIFQGIIRGLASFLGILLGIFFASRFYHSTGEWFADTIYNLNSPEVSALIGFLILITFIWAFCVIVGEILYRIVHFTPLAALDKALGLLFGFCKAFLLLSIVVFGISQIGWLKNFSQSIEQHSSFFPAMKNLAIYIMNLEQIQELTKDLEKPSTDKIEQTITEGVNKISKPVEETKEELKEDLSNSLSSLKNTNNP